MTAPPTLDDATFIAIAVLREGIQRGPSFDMRTDRTFEALAHLDQVLPGASVRQFRRALEFEDAATRWRECKDALFSIDITVAAVIGGFVVPDS